MTKVIACRTVCGELSNLLRGNTDMTVLEYGLHNTPDLLHRRVRDEIDSTKPRYDTILLGYGLCANSLIGIKSGPHQLVIPRVDDCIALFLGSRMEYTRQFRKVPGTFYLTKGWVDCGEDPYTEYLQLMKRYPPKKALKIAKRYILHYTRLAYIKIGEGDDGEYIKYAKMVADYFTLDFEFIRGSNRLFTKLIEGNWDDEFIVVEPGDTVRYELFHPKVCRV